MPWIWVVGAFVAAAALYVAFMKVWPTDPQKAAWIAAAIVFAHTIHRAVTEPEAGWTQTMIVVSMIIGIVLVGRLVGVRPR